MYRYTSNNICSYINLKISYLHGSWLCTPLFSCLFLLIGIVESNWVHPALWPPMAYCASLRWLWWWRNWWNDWQGKPKYSEKTCPSAALSTTNPTCCPDANPGRRDGKPATNRLSYGTALFSCLIFIFSYPRVETGVVSKCFPRDFSMGTKAYKVIST
jgi:hypothetical protein